AHEVLESIYKDLMHQINGYVLPFELTRKLKIFKKYSDKRKIEHFPSLYLDIEDFLLFQDDYASKSKQDYREVFLMEYPAISKFPELYVIFLDPSIQKIALSRLFLKEALSASKTLLGNFKDPFLLQAERILDGPFSIDRYSTHIEINSAQKETLDYTTALQHKLSDSLGNNAMLSIYNSAFNKHFNNYYLLETFTGIVNLIPEDLLVLEEANMPSKSQMHRLLKTQIRNLEDINIKLSKEIQERKNIQKELERNERLYSAVLHNSLNANIIIDQSGEIVRWNLKAEELFNKDENLFKLLPKIFTVPLKKTLQGNTLKEIKQLIKQNFEFSMVIDGKENEFQLKISPIFVENEVLFFCIANNVSGDF
ncbi:MAG: PAS domain S-box protein, partial [Bacteroidetes bacterium]|nr:PAS domain S-box protein [Bacteroidota bacterium]